MCTLIKNNIGGNLKNFFKKEYYWTGEMILWLRVHTALPVNMSLVPVLGGIEPPVTRSLKDPMFSSSFHKHIHEHTQTYICTLKH